MTTRWTAVAAVALAAGLGVALAFFPPFAGPDAARAQDDKPAPKDAKPAPKEEEPTKAPEFKGGTAWLNTGKEISIKDLKGKFVLLDFWTLCCINCIHTLPDIAKLEDKYANDLVVIGVHSAKFDNEKKSESVRKAILRYEIHHPVVNDPDMKIWDAYGCNSWPTLVLIDPDGNYLGKLSGEGRVADIDKFLTKNIEAYKKKGSLDDKGPIRFDAAKFRDKVDSPLYFPGKVLRRRRRQAHLHRRQHQPPRRRDRPGRHQGRRRRGRHARLPRRRLRPSEVRRPAGHGLDADGTRCTSPTARTTLIRALDLKAEHGQDGGRHRQAGPHSAGRGARPWRWA